MASAVGTFVVVLALASAAQAAPPLVAQWPLEEAHTSGGSDYTEDVSGNGLALTSPANTMRFGTESGKFGGYLASTNTTTLEVNSPLLAPPQVTLLAWVKESGDPGPLHYIAGRGDDGGTCGGSSYALYTGYSGDPGLHFYVRAGESNVLTDAPPDSSVFDGNWHLVAGTYDGSNVRLYVDGSQVGPAKPAAGITYTSPITDPTFYVDGYPPAAGCGGSPDFPGDIDEVRVYDRALSASELGRLAAAPGPQPPVLVPDESGSSPGPSPAPGPGTGPPVEPLTVSVSPVHTTTSSPGYTVLKFGSTGFTTLTKLSIDGGAPIMNINPIATPYVGLRLAEGGSHTITATSFGLGGASVSSSTHVIFPTGSEGLKKPGLLPDVAIASVTAALLAVAETGAVSRECAPGSTVVFGVVEATGCFKRITKESEMPAPERPVGGEYAAESFIVEHLAANAYQVLHHTASASEPFVKLDPAEQPFVSSGPVQLDGMTITPRPGASVVVFPAISRVISSNARISYDGSAFGSIPVQTGAINLDLSSGIKRFTDGNEVLPLFHFNTSEAFKDIGGFPINGDVQVSFEKNGEERYSSLVVNVSLPEEISTAAQADPTAQVEVNADDSRGTYLNHLNIHMDEALLGPIRLSNVDFTYNDGGDEAEGCLRKWWKATAEVYFVPGAGDEGAGVRMAPEPQRNGVAFCAGKFAGAGAVLDFGDAGPEIFPGVILTEVGFDIRLAEPALFDGSATIKSADIVTAKGGFLTVLASSTHPYTIQAGDAGGTLKGLVGQTYYSPTVAIGGTVSVEPYPEVGLELGGAYLLYSYPGFIAAKGYAHLQTFLFTVNAEGSVELSTSTRKFNAVVKGEVCLLGGIEILGFSACAGAEARVSSRGISVCFDIGGWKPGVGYVYGATLPEFFTGLPGDGCRPSHFWEKEVRAARASALAPITFAVKRGEKVKSIRLTGAGGAPEVSVRTPGGETITSQANKMFRKGHLSAITSEKYKATWLGVEDAKPGTYEIISQPGSPAITGVAETHYEPEAGVSGKLTHKGRRYVLHYNAGQASGQKVTFIERGKTTMRPLRTVSGGKGTIVFEPALAHAGEREIVASVEVGGIPASPQTLARFSASPPPRAGQVTHVRVTRGRGAISVSWRKAPFATSYSVILKQQGGGVRTLRVKGNAHSARLQNIIATASGRIEVIAFGALGDQGRAGRASFKALSKEQTRLLSFKELGRGSPFVHHKGRAKRRG
jgi:Concanavalin A-like lectin/glucanases superfamily